MKLLIALFIIGLFIPHQADASITRTNIIQSVNEYRKAQHLPELKVDDKLQLGAQKRADDMFLKDYWSHVSPEGKRGNAFASSAGYYGTIGEALARRFQTTPDTLKAWINSPTHKAILEMPATNIGVGIVYGNEPIVVLFIAQPLTSQ